MMKKAAKTASIAIFLFSFLFGPLSLQDIFASDVDKKLQSKRNVEFGHSEKLMDNMPYQLDMEDGTIIKGVSDRKGKIVSVYKEKPEKISLNFLENEEKFAPKNDDKKKFFLISNERTGNPVPYAPYQITMPNGTVIEGQADEDGETVTIYTDKPELLTMKRLKSSAKSMHIKNNDQNDREGFCYLHTPGPLLNRTKYKDYKLGSQNGKSYTEEKVTLARGVKLTVEAIACADFSTTTVSFIVPKKILYEKSQKEKLIWMRSQLDDLSWKENYSNPSENIDSILKVINSAKPFLYGKFQQIEVCRDGTIPAYENECSWEAGGGTKYKWRENDTYIYLVFSYSRSV